VVENSESAPDVLHILDSLSILLARHVILPPHAAHALALWVVHTYAFELRDVTAYIGVQSPEKGCGKSTLLSVLGLLCNRSVLASNISASAFFRVIAETVPTLLIDEADTSLHNNDELRGILNSGYTKPTAFVIRVSNESSSNSSSTSDGGPVSCIASSPSSIHGEPGTPQHSTLNPQPKSGLRHFSTWCPKAIAAIGHLPETLADRCILIQMKRKSTDEVCARLRDLEPSALRQACAQFVAEHSHSIRTARPQIPPGLGDRAADIWEPLLAIADLAGGDWPAKARNAAVALSASAQEANPIAALLLDVFYLFLQADQKRLFSRTILAKLAALSDRPWQSLKGAKGLNDNWLAQQLRPYGIRPKILRIGEYVGRGYTQTDVEDASRRYVPRSQVEAFKREILQLEDEAA
jgi:hypothetical protein